jgi:hypothetical protein
MTIKEVKNFLKIIRQTEDSEMLFILQDALYESVLEAIAEGDCENPKECARLALYSKDKVTYLYITEDFSIFQSNVEPTDNDKKEIKEGILRVVFFKDGLFWEYDLDNEEGDEVMFFEKR